MRIEVENNHMTLDEFVEKLEASREPVELTRDGTIVATAARKAKKGSASSSEKIIARGMELVQKARANAKKHGLSERQAVKLACDAVEEVRQQKKAGAEWLAFLDAAQEQTAKLGLTQKQIEQLVDRAVREDRRKHAKSRR